VNRPGQGEVARRRVCDHRAADGQGQVGDPAQQVMGQRGEDEPGGVGREAAGGAVGERFGFEVADGELDHGVAAVVGFPPEGCPRAGR